MALDLRSFRNNVTSQDGEDGILAEILNRLEISKGWCVEFGAWDGKLLSNTWTLWHDHGWQAVLIEGDQPKYAALEASMQSRKNVHCIRRYVSATGENCLDTLLDLYKVPMDFEVLSIDIDGNDYYVWKELTEHRPKIVIIEFNSSIPPSMEFVEENRNDNRLGSSALSLLKLAGQKGYQLATGTAGNLIFVEGEVFPKLGIKAPKLEDIFPYDKLTFLISHYDGALFATRAKPVHASIETVSGLRTQVLANHHVPQSFYPVALISIKSENEIANLLVGLLRQGKLMRKALLGFLRLANKIKSGLNLRSTTSEGES